jgi:hypothetical protein
MNGTSMQCDSSGNTRLAKHSLRFQKTFTWLYSHLQTTHGSINRAISTSTTMSRWHSQIGCSFSQTICLLSFRVDNVFTPPSFNRQIPSQRGRDCSVLYRLGRFNFCKLCPSSWQNPPASSCLAFSLIYSQTRNEWRLCGCQFPFSRNQPKGARKRNKNALLDAYSF